MKRRLVAVLAVIGMLSTMLVGCSSGESAGESAEVKTEESSGEVAEEEVSESDDDNYIAMMFMIH